MCRTFSIFSQPEMCENQLQRRSFRKWRRGESPPNVTSDESLERTLNASNASAADGPRQITLSMWKEEDEHDFGVHSHILPYVADLPI